jgi:class 3 adenylate cyclase
MKTPLRRKILLYSSSVLIVLIVVMLVFVSFQAGRFVDERIKGDLQKGRERVKAVEEDTLRDLKLTATVLGSTPVFFSALNTNTDTVRDTLSDYRQRTGVDVLIALNESGQVVARTDMPEPAPIDAEPDSRILKTSTATYNIAIVPADTTGKVFGYVLAGSLIDDKFARALQGAGDEVVIADTGLLGSTVVASTLPWKTQADLEKAVGKDAEPRIVDAAGENYEAVGTILGAEKGPRPFVVIMQSRTRAMRPYRGIQIGLLVLGIIATITGIGSSAVLAHNITAPVAKLVEGTRQVASGNFDYRLDIPSTDEIGDLASSFNTMTQGLRERADMQKFVSMSTVEMIQSTTRKVSAGEKVVLTIFFSDMRGFTSMSENRPPEETVKLLNTCLSLQAERVKKFKGDIDKFVGDCVVALFTGDDMELNAIRCAVETHRGLRELNASRPDEPPIRVGIGIVTGEVILGSIGSEDRLDYTVIGSNVNLCSRLCSSAGPGETLLAESTYSRVQGLVAAETVAPIQVKGFTAPIPVYKMH